ncbi:hypothetical protein [Mangrovimonas sp. DI 80]|uniref:hypothetical protein n=1 Tax=Mangrovimonas sp. DI 80 TaxID=1779330 RepID=UPI0009773120|nr:hypothetical protein [Mangrovimonas sp. DI 80]OMP30385.1 hypothetical protein BKM32_13470 [Mangrovimonas sp. DI 80]
MKIVLTGGMLLMASLIFAQKDMDTTLPYYEIPQASEIYTAGTVAARMVDGLGFRYYWATEGLTETDLAYSPSSEVRSTGETIDHILNLSYVVLDATLKQPNTKRDFSNSSFEEKRKQTLLNLKQTADILRASNDLSDYKIVFGEREFPFWNAINGPLADAIWHAGQIASFRRSSGNPINSNISQFNGTVKQ